MATNTPTQSATSPVATFKTLRAGNDAMAMMAIGDATIKPMIAQYAYNGSLLKINLQTNKKMVYYI